MTSVITPALVVHGGAGDLEPGRDGEARAGCRRATEIGLAVLAGGGSSLDAVEAAVRALEDDPAFNAGTGASLTREGVVECDASIMDGATLRVGAVASLADCDRAIAVARAVLDDGEHVLLCADGAWQFAREHGFAPVPRAQLITARSAARLAAERQRRGLGGTTGVADPGTVGACAVDGAGHVAAATSTGGTTFKRHGRIGDTPLPGCGTYADDEGGAASATGTGELIMRVSMSRVAVDAMRAGRSASEAAWHATAELSRRLGGGAGIICCDARGRLGAALATHSLAFAAGRVGGSRLVDGVSLEAGADLDAMLG